MKEILDKISSYNLFNYLFPGVLFAFFAEKITGYSLLSTDIFTVFFYYYFIGLIISRIGSLLIEPFLKKVKFVKFSTYNEFVLASKVDDKIDLFSEINNTYRTLISMILLLIMISIFKHLSQFYSLLQELHPVIFLLILLLLFLYSYRKQTNYITNRINSVKYIKPNLTETRDQKPGVGNE